MFMLLKIRRALCLPHHDNTTPLCLHGNSLIQIMSTKLAWFSFTRIKSGVLITRIPRTESLYTNDLRISNASNAFMIYEFHIQA